MSALSWGAADVAGGLASRRAPALGVVFLSQILGGLIALGIAAVRVEPWPSASDAGLSVIAGLCGPTALVAFYRGLAVGRMHVVAPVAGVLGAAIPVVFAAATEGLPAPVRLVGIALALVAVALLTSSARTAERGPSGIREALVAGALFGVFYIVLGQVSAASVFWPLVLVRATAAIVLTGLLVMQTAPWRPPRSVAGLIIVTGTLDIGGNVWYLLAAQQGRLDVAAVLSSMYPLVTVLLAAVLLRERMRPSQAVGVVVAMLAIGLIGAGQAG